MKHLLDWFTRLSRWLFTPSLKRGLIKIVAPAFTVLVIAKFLPGNECKLSAIRYLGLLFQLTGYWYLFRVLDLYMMNIGQPAGWAVFKTWLRSYPRWNLQVVVCHMGSASSSRVALGTARVTASSQAKPHTLEDRLIGLEKSIEQLREDHNKVRDGFKQELNQLKHLFESTKTYMDSNLKSLEARNNQQVVSTVRPQVYATCWFFIGAIYATAPEIFLKLVR